MPGQFDRIGKGVLDQAAFCSAQQLGQRIAQGDGGDSGKKLG